MILLGFFLFLGTIDAQESGEQVSKRDRFKQYLNGVQYLDAAGSLTQEEKVAYYKKLEELTGFTAESAQEFTNRYNDNPEKWIKLIDEIIAVISSPTEQKE